MPLNSSRNYNHGQKSLGQSERNFNSLRFTCDCRVHIFSDNLSQNSCIWRSDSWFGDGPSLSSSWLTILEFSSRTAFKNFSNTPLAKVGFYLNSNFSNCRRWKVQSHWFFWHWPGKKCLRCFTNRSKSLFKGLFRLLGLKLSLFSSFIHLFEFPNST